MSNSRQFWSLKKDKPKGEREERGRFKVKILEDHASDVDSISIPEMDTEEKTPGSLMSPGLLSPRESLFARRESSHSPLIPHALPETPRTPSPRPSKNSRFETEVLEETYDENSVPRGNLGRFQFTSVSVDEDIRRKSASYSGPWDVTPVTPSSRRGSSSVMSTPGYLEDADEYRTRRQPGTGSASPARPTRFVIEEEPSEACESEESSVRSLGDGEHTFDASHNSRQRDSLELYDDSSLPLQQRRRKSIPQPPEHPPPPPPHDSESSHPPTTVVVSPPVQARRPSPPSKNGIAVKLPVEVVGKPLTDWSVRDCALWARSLGKPYHTEAEIFEREGVTGDMLYRLTKRDCDRMDFSSDLAKKKILASRNHLVAHLGMVPHSATAASIRQEFLC